MTTRQSTTDTPPSTADIPDPRRRRGHPRRDCQGCVAAARRWRLFACAGGGTLSGGALGWLVMQRCPRSSQPWRKAPSRACRSPFRSGRGMVQSRGGGKSSLIETMVCEIVRIGGGCGVIDAKGDLADCLLRILPHEAYDRAVVIATTAAMAPCINPFDRRIIGAKPHDVVAGEIGEIFARIEPEI